MSTASAAKSEPARLISAVFVAAQTEASSAARGSPTILFVSPSPPVESSSELLYVEQRNTEYFFGRFPNLQPFLFPTVNDASGRGVVVLTSTESSPDAEGKSPEDILVFTMQTQKKDEIANYIANRQRGVDFVAMRYIVQQQVDGVTGALPKSRNTRDSSEQWIVGIVTSHWYNEFFAGYLRYAADTGQLQALEEMQVSFPHKSALDSRFPVGGEVILKCESMHSSMTAGPRSRPDNTLFRHIDTPLSSLLFSFGVEALELLLSIAFQEGKILFVGKTFAQASSCVHALCGVLYPWKWSQMLLPVVPPTMVDIVTYPLPFIAGTICNVVPRILVMAVKGIWIADATTGNVALNSESGVPLPLLPMTFKLKDIIGKHVRKCDRDQWLVECSGYPKSTQTPPPFQLYAQKELLVGFLDFHVMHISGTYRNGLVTSQDNSELALLPERFLPQLLGSGGGVSATPALAEGLLPQNIAATSMFDVWKQDILALEASGLSTVNCGFYELFYERCIYRFGDLFLDMANSATAAAELAQRTTKKRFLSLLSRVGDTVRAQFSIQSLHASSAGYHSKARGPQNQAGSGSATKAALSSFFAATTSPVPSSGGGVKPKLDRAMIEPPRLTVDMLWRFEVYHPLLNPLAKSEADAKAGRGMEWLQRDLAGKGGPHLRSRNAFGEGRSVTPQPRGTSPLAPPPPKTAHELDEYIPQRHSPPPPLHALVSSHSLLGAESDWIDVKHKEAPHTAAPAPHPLDALLQSDGSAMPAIQINTVSEDPPTVVVDTHQQKEPAIVAADAAASTRPSERSPQQPSAQPTVPQPPAPTASSFKQPQWDIDTFFR